jgi:hypothetical protein
MLPEYKVMEDNISRLIASIYKVPYPWPGCVKEADERALYTEARDLMLGTQDWDIPDGNALSTHISPMIPEMARERFMHCFSRLAL